MDKDDPVGRLYARAKHHGISMADICRRGGVAVTTPSRWKNGRNGLNWGTLQKLSEALDDIIAGRAHVEAEAA